MRGFLGDRQEIREIPRAQRYPGRLPLARLFADMAEKDRQHPTDRIVQAHITYGYTLKEIADSLNVHYTTVSKIVAGSRKMIFQDLTPNYFSGGREIRKLEKQRIVESNAKLRRRVIMPAFWCVNFDIEYRVLEHGLQESLWLMQYQYSHDGNAFQGERNQKAATSKNWRVLREIEPEDWLVAYLPSNRFYAIGEVIEPRLRERHCGQPRHEDTIQRTVHEHMHIFRSGVVRYTDAAVYYEDFTDPWNQIAVNKFSHKSEVWLYPQRIDVKQWEYIVHSGIEVQGLAKAVSFPRYRDAAFQIPEPFFDKIRVRLRQASNAGDFAYRRS